MAQWSIRKKWIFGSEKLETDVSRRKNEENNAKNCTACTGFEPVISALRGQRPGPLDEQAFQPGTFQPRMGFEPTAYGLQNRCSTIELPRQFNRNYINFSGVMEIFKIAWCPYRCPSGIEKFHIRFQMAV